MEYDKRNNGFLYTLYSVTNHFILFNSYCMDSFFLWFSRNIRARAQIMLENYRIIILKSGQVGSYPAVVSALALKSRAKFFSVRSSSDREMKTFV